MCSPENNYLEQVHVATTIEVQKRERELLTLRSRGWGWAGD